jgi:hypothetical protein
MGRKTKKIEILQEQNFEIDFREFGFDEERYPKLKIIPPIVKENSIPASNKIAEHLPGKRLRNNDFEICYSKGMYLCGYLREPHLYQENHSSLEKFAGLCALCDFQQCKFPRALNRSHKNDCPVLVKYEKIAIEKAQIIKEDEI